jgi:hypothetical protein
MNPSKALERIRIGGVGLDPRRTEAISPAATCR